MTARIDPRIDHYKTLGVSEKADAEEIKKNYRKLAKRYHPDRTGGDKAKETRFKEISQAYDVLGDPDKRRQYDAMRSGGPFPGFSGQGFPGGGFPGDASSHFSNDGMGGLGDLFSHMFNSGTNRPGPGGMNFRFTRGQGNQRPRPSQPRNHPTKPSPRSERKIRLSDGSTAMQRGNDVYADVRLSVDQAILGAVVEVGTVVGASKIKIPPGTDSGRKLRLKGKGSRDSKGARGNHIVTVHIEVPKNLDEKTKKLLIQLMRRVKKT